MEWRFEPQPPDSADNVALRVLCEAWGYSEPGLWVVKQSAALLEGAAPWWAGYTHEARGRELTIEHSGQPVTLTFPDPETGDLRVVFAFRVRVYHDASGLFLERISYPDGRLTLSMGGLLDTSPLADIKAAWRGRAILAHTGYPQGSNSYNRDAERREIYQAVADVLERGTRIGRVSLSVSPRGPAMSDSTLSMPLCAVRAYLRRLACRPLSRASGLAAAEGAA